MSAPHDDPPHVPRIEAKIDKIGEDISEIKVMQAEVRVDLNYHIKRTDILEETVKPVIEFMAMAKGVSKFIGIIALGAGIIEGIVVLLEYLNRVK